LVIKECDLNDRTADRRLAGIPGLPCNYRYAPGTIQITRELPHRKLMADYTQAGACIAGHYQ
jgi:hypothetical protein